MTGATRLFLSMSVLVSAWVVEETPPAVRKLGRGVANTLTGPVEALYGIEFISPGERS